MSQQAAVDSDTIASLSPDGDPWLLTPGPLTTSVSVKQAMLHDYGSRDHDFIAMNRRIRDRILNLAADPKNFVCVPLQGSGTFVVEAMLGTFVPVDGKALVLENGAYGQRIVKILQYHGRQVLVQSCPENMPVSPRNLQRTLMNNRDISHVIVVHYETTTGILNPLKSIAKVVKSERRSLLIDAMSSFGAIDTLADKITFDAMAASSNKCLQGAPGMGFCIARKDALLKGQGNSASLSLDLYEQWLAMELNGQWRFTPPVQVLAALDQALHEHAEEGGVAGRFARYSENCRVLIEGMRRLGFKTLLPTELQAPIIVTFLMPDHPGFEFQPFYDALRERGYVIYPGKLTVAETFRIGCIGALGLAQIEGALEAVADTLKEMRVDLIETTNLDAKIFR